MTKAMLIPSNSYLIVELQCVQCVVNLIIESRVDSFSVCSEFDSIDCDFGFVCIEFYFGSDFCIT